jgi:imidazolonepropionase-like amidohydrolase
LSRRIPGRPGRAAAVSAAGQRYHGPVETNSVVAEMETTLYRDGALADGRSERLRIGVSILVVDGRIAWIRPSDDEGPRPAAGKVEVVDASGCAFVPGMVDCHSHLTLPGGAHWIDHVADPPGTLLATAEHTGRLMTASGVRWARDVGAPVAIDPIDGRERALNLGVRERWRGRAGFPYVRAAGTWLDKEGTRIGRPSSQAANPEELLGAAVRQLDDGADLLKLYLDGPEPGVSPWTAAELTPVVEAAHSRGIKVTAHSGNLAGAREGVSAGVDSLEHGMELDADVCAEMARRGIALVSTLAVFRSWRSFGDTTVVERFVSPEGRARVAAREERAQESVRLAHAAGVAIACGTDFGGGSTRADQLAWEVESLVAAGLEPWEGLAAATWRGGELLGEADAGVIREGGPADFAMVHGDPLSDPSALWRVWRVAWV